MTDTEFIDLLKKFEQNKMIDCFRAMNEADKERILKQTELMDFNCLQYAKSGEDKPRGVISPIRTMKLAEIDEKREHYREIGIKAIQEGKIAALVLGGGMGTRLGSPHAKGMFDIGTSKNVYIYQRMIENMLDVVKEAKTWIPLIIMTSYINDAETRQFLWDKKCFGYNPKYISFFIQDMAPCLDENDQMMLAKPDELAMSPNGNGGFYSSMINCGLADKCKKAGIEYLNVFAVDNVLQRIADPVFIGATIESGCATGAKVVKKSNPGERVGSICMEDGAPSVVEYYEMTEELLDAVDETGEPAYSYGVILNYLFKLEVMDSVVKEKLPFHKVKKKVPYLAKVDDSPTGYATIQPAEPNAFKLETLTLDMVHLMGTCLPFEVIREKEFAPIKNAMGVDSVQTARELLLLNGYEL
ncbi:MAG: UTP--glucose-1-phosphate uridylyltransferase [Lachnospiraceae bacterium]|nr:UTP--glucose-1-phosphate uridylyltransferase [Lachnospiraceae bacterium]